MAPRRKAPSSRTPSTSGTWRRCDDYGLGEVSCGDAGPADKTHVADRDAGSASDRLQRPEREPRPDEKRADVRRVARDGHSWIAVVLRHVGGIESHTAWLPRERPGLVAIARVDDHLTAQRRHGHRA